MSESDKKEKENDGKIEQGKLTRRRGEKDEDLICRITPAVKCNSLSSSI